MVTIGSFRDLEKYGIDCLTGEACAYDYRVLCDLTERGIKLVAAVYGLEVEQFKASLSPAWNSRGVKSIMLPACMIEALGVFACIQSNCSKVYVMYNGSVVGIEDSDKPQDVEMWLSWNQGKYCEACRRYGAGGGVNRQYSNPGYSRNIHQMSGRTE